MPKYFFYTLFFCLLCMLQTEAQDVPVNSGFGIEANMIGGRIIKHTKKFTAPIPPLSGALDVNFLWQTYGKKDWQQRRNFPVIGIGITCTDYGNSAVLGNSIGVYPNLQIPLIHRGNVEWTLRIGDGLAYVSRKYQTIAPIDTTNNAIGSHLNDFAVVMTDLRYHVNDHWQVQCGLSFTHISNADYHQPNLGINLGGIHAGVQYSPVTNRPKKIIKELTPLKNRWLIQARTGITYNEARADGDPVVPSYIFSVYASKRWHSNNKLIIGLDYGYHTDVYDFLKRWNVEHGHEMGHAWDGAFFAGNEFLIGRVGILTSLGIYYHQTYLKFDPFYEKFGCNYYLLQHEHGPVKELFLSAMLLAHEITAQYGEFGIGVGF